MASAAPATTDAKLVKEMQQREGSCMLVLHLTLILSMTLPVTVTRGAAGAGCNKCGSGNKCKASRGDAAAGEEPVSCSSSQF